MEKNGKLCLREGGSTFMRQIIMLKPGAGEIINHALESEDSPLPELALQKIEQLSQEGKSQN